MEAENSFTDTAAAPLKYERKFKMQNTFKFTELKAGNFLLKRNQDGTWKVFKWCIIPYSTESTYKLIGDISIPNKKIRAYINKPHSGACDTSISMLIKAQLGITHH